MFFRGKNNKNRVNNNNPDKWNGCSSIFSKKLCAETILFSSVNNTVLQLSKKFNTWNPPTLAVKWNLYLAPARLYPHVVLSLRDLMTYTQPILIKFWSYKLCKQTPKIFFYLKFHSWSRYSIKKTHRKMIRMRICTILINGVV